MEMRLSNDWREEEEEDGGCEGMGTGWDDLRQ